MRTNNNISTLDTFEYDSDHMAVELIAQLPKIEFNAPRTVYNYEKADWNIISRALSELLINFLPDANRNLSRTEIDVSIDLLNKTINDILEQNVPKYKITNGNLLILNDVTIKCIKLKKIFKA